MEFTSLHLQNFKRFANFTVKFNSLEIIYGENEKGKSTIIAGILSALFVDASTNSKAFFEKVKHWKNEMKPIVELEFEYEEKKYKLSRDYNQKASKLINLTDNIEESSADQIKKKIDTFLGIQNDFIYRAVGILNGHEMSNLDDVAKINDALSKIASGNKDEGDINKVILNISNEINDLTRGVSRASNNPGPIRQLEEKIAKLDSDIDISKSQFQKYIESIKIKDESSLRLDKVKERIEVLAKSLENNSILEAGKQKLFENENLVKVIQKEISEVSLLKQQFAELERDLKSTDFDIDTFKRNELEIASIKEKIEITKNDITDLESKLNSKKTYFEESSRFKQKENKLILLTGYLFTIIVSIFLIILKWWPLLIGSIISILILLTYQFLNKRTPKLDKGSLYDLEDKVSDQKNNLKQQEVNLKDLFREMGISSENEFYERKIQIESKEENIYQISNFLSNKIQVSSSENLVRNVESYLVEKKSELDNLLLKKREIEVSEVEKYRDYEFSSERRVEIDTELDNLYDEKAKLEEQKVIAKTRINDSEINQEKINLLEEELSYSKEIYEKYREKLRSLELVRFYLDKAKKNTSKTLSTLLKLEIDKYLPRITNNQYTESRLDDEFNLQVFSIIKQDWLTTDVLSVGAIGQIFMLMKIAYFKMLTNEKQSPIIMDDPFITFDDTRKRESLNILKEISESNQVLIFTCDKSLPITQNIV